MSGPKEAGVWLWGGGGSAVLKDIGAMRGACFTALIRPICSMHYLCMLCGGTVVLVEYR